MKTSKLTPDVGSNVTHKARGFFSFSTFSVEGWMQSYYHLKPNLERIETMLSIREQGINKSKYISQTIKESYEPLKQETK